MIVEVDGGSHRGRERADGRRQRALEAAGYRVVRFEVRQEGDGRRIGGAAHDDAAIGDTFGQRQFDDIAGREAHNA